MTNVFDQTNLADLADNIDAAVHDLIQRRARKMVPNEESFSEQLLAAIKGEVHRYSLDLKPKWSHGLFPQLTSPGAIQLEAFQLDERRKSPIHMDGRTLTHHGKGAEETQVGADILLVLETKGIEGLEPIKGILAQAKKHDGDFNYTAAADLFDQCHDMAVITDSSYAVIYADNGLFLFDNPITSGVELLEAANVDGTIGETVARFIDCGVGDKNITEKRVGHFGPMAAALRDRRFRDAARAMNVDALVIKAGV